MQEGSLWLYALAQQIASHYRANPKVAAVLVEGSVARGYADHSSDIDLAVFWARPPTAKERRDIVKRAGGRYRHWQPCTLLCPSSTQRSSRSGSSKRLPIRTNWPWRWYGNTCAFAPPGSRNSWRSATMCWSSTTPSVPPRSISCSSSWGSTASTILAGGGWID
jgi:Polymerase beta, Nucleotidyltransferase